MSEQRIVVLRAIENYNRYRSPEAVAKLVETGEGYVVIDFTGSFCFTCGVYDWFEDFIYELRQIEERYRVEISSVVKNDYDSFRVRYVVKSG